MRLKLTLTLLVILLGLLTYIFYIDPWGDSRAIEDHDRNALASLAVDIDYLSIYNAAQSVGLSIELQEDGWILTQPYRWPANTFAVERILNQLQFLDTKVSFDADRLDQAGTSLKEYGLEPPEITLEFGKGETAYSIGIGNATAVGNHLYLLSHDQSKIHVVDRSLLDSLSIELEALRNPRIFRSNIFEVESWNLQLREANNLRTRITKNNDLWILETPIRTRADSIEVNTLLGRLLELKSQNIVQPTPIELSMYGLSDPFLRIALESGQSREALEVGDPVNGDDESLRWAKLESRDTVFELEIDYLSDLEAAQTQLRDRHIIEVDTAYATSISYDRDGQGSFDLQKLETGEWDILTLDQEQGIVREKGSSEAVEEALAWLATIQAIATDNSSGFVHDAPTAADLEDYGLEVPDFSISIASNRTRDQSEALDSPQTETLLFGIRERTDRSIRYVKLKEKDFVYHVSNDTISLIADQAFEFRDRNLFDLPEGARVSKIAIGKLSSGQILFNKSDSEPQFPRQLSKELESFRVKSYLQNAYTSNVQIAGKRQPWAYSLNLTFVWTVADVEQSRDVELYLSELTGGPLLIGGSIENNTVFEFRQRFIDAFSGTVFNRVKRDLPEQPFDPNTPLSTAAEQPTSGGNQ